MNNISLGIIFGLLALFSNGMSGFLAKIPSQRMGPNKLIFYRNILNTIMLSVIVLCTLGQTTFSLKYILLAFLLSFFGYIPMYYFYKAAAIGKMGVISPVASANALIATVLAIVFFHEKLTLIQSIFIAMIIFGVILISIDFKSFKKSHIFSTTSGVPYAFVAALGWGIWSFLVKIPASFLGPYLTSLIIESGAIFVALYLLLREKEELKLKKGHWAYIIPVSVFLVLWSLAFYQGLKVANVSLVIPLSAASPLVVVLLSRIFYRERLTLLQYLAIPIIVAGIVMISI